MRSPRLTPHQQRVLGLAADGLDMAEIGRRVGRHPVTIEQVLARARRRLGARNTAQAVGLAIIAGLIAPVPPVDAAR